MNIELRLFCEEREVVQLLTSSECSALESQVPIHARRTLVFLPCSCTSSYMLNLSTLTVQQLERAVTIKQQIGSLEKELQSLGASEGQGITPKRGRRKSGGTDGKIETPKVARKARVAKRSASKEISNVTPAPESDIIAKRQSKKRGPMSPEHRAKLAKANKDRWAKIKAQDKAKL